jgi:hypothetical protein
VTLVDEEAPPIPEVEITGPGVYTMPSEQYHARPELSHSGMKLLLPPSCAALFKWEKANAPAPKEEFDFGNALHALILGAGSEVKVLKFDSWRTNAAKEAKQDAYDDGKIPILEKHHAHVKAMAWQIQNHPVAKHLFTDGKPEQSLFWKDRRTGINLRARVDWLRDPYQGRRLVIPDLKSTTAVDTASLEKAIYDWRYHSQGAMYRDAAIALGLGGEDTVVDLVFQMKTPPYLVHVVQLTPGDLQLGAARNRAAIDIYRECVESGYWPGYDEVSHIEIPAWAQTRDTLEYM